LQRLIACIALLALLFGSTPVQTVRASTVRSAMPQPATAIAGRYIVRLKPSTGFSTSSIVASYDAMSGVAVDQIYQNVVTGFAGSFTDAAAHRLAADPGVQDVFPDRLTWPAAQTVPPGIKRVDADLNPTHAGDGNGSVDADIAILDTGIYQHPDLNVVGGMDCTLSRLSGPFHDISGHGTHVAGTAAAEDNGSGVVGVAPGARLWAIKIFSDDGGGAARESEVICALDYVRAHADVIDAVNLSIGADYGYDLGGCGATVYHQAYCNLVVAGVTVIVAAQNWTINARTVVPAQFDEVVTVSALYDGDGLRGGLGPNSDCTPRGGIKGVQKDDTFACFSNYGADIDIAAPGMDVYSTYSADADQDDCPSPTFCFMSGTSMATPHVSGAVALLVAQQGRMSPSAIKARLLTNAEPGPVPLDPDSFHEPMLNVGVLDPGGFTVPERANVGDRVPVTVTGFAPETRVILRVDGIYLGGLTVGDDGSGDRTVTIPALNSGLHVLTASNNAKTLAAPARIAPLVRLATTSGPVGSTPSITLRGFRSGESILITIDSGNEVRTLSRVTASTATGSANVIVTIPPSPAGKHRVSAVGSLGSSTRTTWTTQPSAAVTAGDAAPGALVRIAWLGFAASVPIEARFDTQAGPVLASGMTSPTGSGSLAVRISGDVTAGRHYLWLIDSAGNKVRVVMDVTGEAANPPPPTAAATPTLAPSAIATATSSAMSSATPTKSPTLVPIETPTVIASATTAVIETTTPVEASPVGP